MTFLEEAIKILNDTKLWNSSSTLAILSMAENIDKIRQVVENNCKKPEAIPEVKEETKQLKFWFKDEETDFSDLNVVKQVIERSTR